MGYLMPKFDLFVMFDHLYFQQPSRLGLRNIPIASPQWGKTSSTHTGCPGYDSTQLNGEAPVLELWGMWSTPLLLLLPGLLCLGVVVPDRVLFMESNITAQPLNCVHTNNRC